MTVTPTSGLRAAGDGRPAHLRDRGEGAAEVRPIELFFDLVYVLAVTQLTRHLLADLTLRGALETLILLRITGWDSPGRSQRVSSVVSSSPSRPSVRAIP